MFSALLFEQCPNKEGLNFDYFFANFEDDQTIDIDFNPDRKIEELYIVNF